MAAMPVCPDEFRCPITLGIMNNPYILVQSSMTYEHEAIQNALSEKPNKDPLTNAAFEGEAQLIPNHSLRKLIQQWREKGTYPQESCKKVNFSYKLDQWFSTFNLSEAKRHEVLTFVCGDKIGATEVDELKELDETSIQSIVNILPAAKRHIFLAEINQSSRESKGQQLEEQRCQAEAVGKRLEWWRWW